MWLWLKYAPNSCWFSKCHRGTSIRISPPAEKKEKEKAHSLVFLCLSRSSLAKRLFLFVFGYPELQSIFCFTHTDFSEKRWGSPHIYENAGLFKSLYTRVGSCTVWRSSWIFLRRMQLYRPKAWSTTADSALARGTLKDNIYKVRQWIQQQFQDFLVVSIRSLTQRASSWNYVDPGNRASSCHPL